MIDPRARASEQRTEVGRELGRAPGKLKPRDLAVREELQGGDQKNPQGSAWESSVQ
jgi:hypothetical protein